MFTGIIRQKGRVAESRSASHGRRLVVVPDGPLECAAGESIAVNGCCLTVVRQGAGGRLEFDIIPETLRATTLGDLRAGDEVNLEAAATAATMLSGHIVQGHIDGVGRAERKDGDATEITLRITPPAVLMPCIVNKGSIAVDGVSLTIARIGPDWFEVALIPETLGRTTLARIGATPAAVNLEADYLVKAVVNYLERLPDFSRR